ncbi:MAG: hypothetical protein H0U75_01685 [Legionella sp.]|nr:hypothetical protein [Legionella sp.]
MYKTIMEAEDEFEKCWLNQSYTPIELEDVDINKTLLHYTTNKPIAFTRKMLWDMEIKKAWDPGKYIPYVVCKGSAQAWGKQSCSDGEIFVRKSEQKQWLTSIYEEIYEEVYVNYKEQVVTFLGVTVLPGQSKRLMPKQPLFHVKHAVGGEEMHPLNKWRIVHFTEERDLKLIEHFKSFNDPTTLPGFIEMYIKEDLGAVIKKP